MTIAFKTRLLVVSCRVPKSLGDPCAVYACRLQSIFALDLVGERCRRIRGLERDRRSVSCGQSSDLGLLVSTSQYKPFIMPCSHR
jgi:hypothetical protein